MPFVRLEKLTGIRIFKEREEQRDGEKKASKRALRSLQGIQNMTGKTKNKKESHQR